MALLCSLSFLNGPVQIEEEEEEEDGGRGDDSLWTAYSSPMTALIKDNSATLRLQSTATI